MARVVVAWHGSRLLLHTARAALLVVVILLVDLKPSPTLVSALPLVPKEMSQFPFNGAARQDKPSSTKPLLLFTKKATTILPTMPTQDYRKIKRSTLLNGESASRSHFNRRFNDIVDALNYLRTYGYLNADALSVNSIESAFKVTLKHMRAPRCGNRDVDEVPSKLTSGHNIVRRFAQVSKWSDKLDDNDVLLLKWIIDWPTDDIPYDQLHDTIQKAFKLWSDQTHIPGARSLKLKFEESFSDTDADVNIVWAVDDHGDDYPFDGTGASSNILAHTFYPNYQETGTLNGDIHFDDAENWVLDIPSASSHYVHFPYIMVHEIGHALGLSHSKSQDAVMHPIYKKMNLDAISFDIDDRCAVQWNYIGPTQTCLYVWLLVQVLPRANDTSFQVRGRRQLSTNHNSPEQRLQSMRDRLQHAHIPSCNPYNDIQAKYESLLVQRLKLPLESAKLYGSVVCNYFHGLSSAVQTRRTDRALHSDSTLDVHAYHGMKRSVSFEDLNGGSTDVLLATPRAELNDPAYFNKEFFDKLLLLVAKEMRL